MSSDFEELRGTVYKAGELIGEGSFSSVYTALDTSTQEIVALKRIKVTSSNERIINEVRILKELQLVIWRYFESIN